ncbi:hypothetical protein D3C71_153580 [compost metagenome]
MTIITHYGLLLSAASAAVREAAETTDDIPPETISAAVGTVMMDLGTEALLALVQENPAILASWTPPQGRRYDTLADYLREAIGRTVGSRVHLWVVVDEFERLGAFKTVIDFKEWMDKVNDQLPMKIALQTSDDLGWYPFFLTGDLPANKAMDGIVELYESAHWLDRSDKDRYLEHLDEKTRSEVPGKLAAMKEISRLVKRHHVAFARHCREALAARAA